MDRQASTARVWSRALRIHQYVKNSLVLVPLITAHQFGYAPLRVALLAAFCFSLCASATYLLNDLVDIEADRQHPSKRYRPIASGRISRSQAIIVGSVLLVASFALAATLSFEFVIVQLVYLVLTVAYSFKLKRKMLVDAIVLASLYTIRVVAGAVAIVVPMSAWLLAFSMFVFLCLALVKRYTELVLRIERDLPDSAARNYRRADAGIVASLAAASGFNSVTILALYLSSPSIQQMYVAPELLWLICPILTYWIGRMLILAHRHMMHDDPILFAVRDPISIGCGLIIVLDVLCATWSGWPASARILA